MEEQVVTVRFFRDGSREGIPLDKERIYHAMVDGGPSSEFHSPWSQKELEAHIEFLRNCREEKPTAEKVKEIGKDLGEAIFRIKGIPTALAGKRSVTVHWQLDYPELARIPWELATSNQHPHHHLLLGNVSFVRKVAALVHDTPAQWPTGKSETLRLLFVWGETDAKKVPHEQHNESLHSICEEYGIKLTPQEIPNVEALTELVCRERFHFVHLLAHGALARNEEWGLRLREQVATGEQIARSLASPGSTPALVTVSACDSANERDTSFGSMAYQLHVYGIPLVLASQFRLRTAASVTSVAKVYGALLCSGDPSGLLRPIRRQLAPANNEGWANEVLYSRYRQEALAELTTIARQQAALRHARTIEKSAAADPAKRTEGIQALKRAVGELLKLAEKLESARPRNPEHIAETFGLLGSLHQRMAKLRSSPPDREDLRIALEYYEQGIRADANSHYCGINVVHLSHRVQDKEKSAAFQAITRFSAENAVKWGDFWAHATLGDLEAYEGNVEKAAERYRKFVGAAEQSSTDDASLVANFQSSRRSLTEMLEIFKENGFDNIRAATQAAINVLDSAVKRHS